jgi:hypothetical protein
VVREVLRASRPESKAMRIDIQNTTYAPHWEVLRDLISRDRTLRSDVTMLVVDGVFRFFDATGREIPLKLPRTISDTSLEDRSGQVKLLAWLGWTFGFTANRAADAAHGKPAI